MAAALEDKMTLTFRNEMNEMKNMMKALVPTPVPIKAEEESQMGNNNASGSGTFTDNTIPNLEMKSRLSSQGLGLAYDGPFPPMPPAL
ncbi:hypothetical protein Tco_1376952 [Tanacetum coccineum]